MLPYSSSLRIYWLGQIIYKLETVSKLADTALELYAQGAISIFQEWLAATVSLQTGRTVRTSLDLSELRDLVYNVEMPDSLVSAVYQAKELSSGVVPLEATERLNTLYYSISQNIEWRNRDLSGIRCDLDAVREVCLWFDGLMSRDWNRRDSAVGEI